MSFLFDVIGELLIYDTTTRSWSEDVGDGNEQGKINILSHTHTHNVTRKEGFTLVVRLFFFFIFFVFFSTTNYQTTNLTSLHNQSIPPSPYPPTQSLTNHTYIFRSTRLPRATLDPYRRSYRGNVERRARN